MRVSRRIPKGIVPLLYLAIASARLPVILVADVGVDDASGVLFALASSKLDVLGIAATHGCHRDVRSTARNAQRLLAASNRAEVPVYVGSRASLTGIEPVHDGQHVHGADGFGGEAPTEEELATCASDAPSLSAAEFIATTARARPGEVSVLCFSPMTNVALATLLEPTLPRLLHSLVAMGGAIHVAGNISPLAEANFAMDAEAAALVVRAFQPADACPFVLAPLDMTHQAMVTAADLDLMAAKGGEGVGMYSRAARGYQRFYCERARMCSGSPQHDAHAVAYVVDPDMYTNSSWLQLEVIVGQPGQPAYGMSLLDRRPASRQKHEGEPGGRVAAPEAAAAGSRPPGTLVLLGVDGPRFARTLVEHIATM
jgi:purine nucleosidase